MEARYPGLFEDVMREDYAEALDLVTSGEALETARGGVENGERSFPSRG